MCFRSQFVWPKTEKVRLVRRPGRGRELVANKQGMVEEARRRNSSRDETHARKVAHNAFGWASHHLHTSRMQEWRGNVDRIGGSPRGPLGSALQAVSTRVHLRALLQEHLFPASRTRASAGLPDCQDQVALA